MAIVHLCKNTSFDMEGREYQLTKLISKNLWQVTEERTGRMHEFSTQVLQQHYADGKLVFMEDPNKAARSDKAFKEKPNNFSLKAKDPELEKAKICRAYVKAVELLPCTRSIFEAAIKEVWQKINLPERMPNWTSVNRWKKKYLSSGKDGYALVDSHHRKGNRKERYDLEVIEISKECIDSIYMKRERKTMEDALEEAIVQVTRENKQRPGAQQLPLPTKRLIRRLIDLIPAFDKCAARYGRLAVDAHLKMTR